MRIILTNFGTVGDVHPLLALATELKAHSHHPVLACSPYFESLVTKHGLDFMPLGPHLRETQQDINRAIIDTPGIEEAPDKLYELFATLGDALAQMFSELREICRDVDVLISGPMQPAARMVHEITGIPFVSVQVEHFGGSGTPALQLASAKMVNPLRRQLGLAPLADPLTSGANSPQLALYAMSRHVSPPPRSWPDHYQMVGYFFLEDKEWQPDPHLVEFIEAGDPPVLITFGSMPHDDPERLTGIVLEAIERVGCRAVLQHGWGGFRQSESHWPATVYVVDYVYYPWLLRHVSCVVHHGGPGTAAAAFRAGVPSVFVPHGWDQPIWASIAEGLGCAGPTVPYAELSAERLADAISQTLTHDRYAETAATLGEKIRAEPGVRRARQLIEQLVTKVGRLEKSTEPDRYGAAELVRLERSDRRRSYQTEQRMRKLRSNDHALNR